MKKKLQQKLKAYSAAASALVLAASASSQITHVDANPDIVVENNNSSYQFDINADGTDELEFNAYANSSGEGYVTLRLTTPSTINATRA
jgi:hypothetical protein